ncbi:MAG TPA: hypothetical protein VLJ61_14900 [Pyrinomonadaceae bacterium]|nr:hypothetical protein [Pyrinomonadaceae bacterium]
MQKPHQFLPTEEEETLVTPRFDDEETVVARRVVPLEEFGQAEPVAAQPLSSAPQYTHEPPASRRSWSLAVVVVSALVGGVFGGAGLYLYQSRASSPRATEAHAAQPVVAPTNAPAAPPAEPTPAATLEIVNSQPAAPTAQQNSGAQTDESDATPKGGASAEQHRDAVDSSEADERKADDERAAAPKHGKKGDRDEEIRRDERRARHSDSDDQLSRDDDDNAPVARRVGTITIFDRPRRASRRDRRRSDSDSDRLRRIFEGQPQ